VKLFREEEDLALHLVIDCSASMDVGTPNKMIFAHRLAMALGYVGLVNHNRVAVTTFGAHGAGVAALTPIRGRTNIQRLARFLLGSLSERNRDAGDPKATFREAMRIVGGARSSRGVMVVISDFLIPGGCDDGLLYLGAGALSGTLDCYCLQVLSPGELDPTREQGRGLVGDLRLTDVETGKAAEVTVTPATIARYKQALKAAIDELKRDCRSRGLAHFVVPTDTAIDQLILGSLRRGGLLR